MKAFRGALEKSFLVVLQRDPIMGHPMTSRRYCALICFPYSRQELLLYPYVQTDACHKVGIESLLNKYMAHEVGGKGWWSRSLSEHLEAETLSLHPQVAAPPQLSLPQTPEAHSWPLSLSLSSIPPQMSLSR